MAAVVIRGVVAGLLVLLSAERAAAIPITFNFKILVTSVTNPQLILGQPVAVGDRLRGSYTFDSNAVLQPPSPLSGSNYVSTGIPYGFSFQAPSQFSTGGTPTSSLLVNVFNPALVFPPFVVDRYQVFANVGAGAGPPPPVGLGFVTVALGLADFTGTALTNESLPLVPPNLTLFNSRTFSLQGFTQVGPFPASSLVNGTVVRLTPVPEPGTLALFVTGGAALLCRRRRRPRA